MIILLISVYSPMKDYYIYVPYAWDCRYGERETGDKCGKHLMMNMSLVDSDLNGVYGDFVNAYHNMRINRERKLYCSVIDCAM